MSGFVEILSGVLFFKKSQKSLFLFLLPADSSRFVISKKPTFQLSSLFKMLIDMKMFSL